MKVLIVGGGGREHALAWKAAQSSMVERVYVAPGNAGTAREPKVENVDIAAEDIISLKNFALKNAVELTIVGPEVPLVAGIVDIFEAENLRILGPGRAAAQLEGSKSFSKAFMQRHGIPTAQYQTFTDKASAIDYLKSCQLPVVIKANGLAAGKGVIIAETGQIAVAAISDMLEGNAFGTAGNRIIIEEFLQGEEASFICLVDGKHVLPFATSQDHKARDHGDKGPNTGGMGAYSPAPVVTPEIETRILQEIIYPTVAGMATDGHPYRGFLYAGVMIDANGAPQVLEYNCRLGDPETQPIMMRMRSDLIELCLATLNGTLNTEKIDWDERVALGIVMAAGGYPESYAKGHTITGLSGLDTDNTKIFHAGTQLKNDSIVTSGGRVLCVTALDNTVSEAQQRAYSAAEKISWKDAFYRRDIGYRAIAREA